MPKHKPTPEELEVISDYLWDKYWIQFEETGLYDQGGPEWMYLENEGHVCVYIDKKEIIALAKEKQKPE